jgi:hypothetical protein
VTQWKQQPDGKFVKEVTIDSDPRKVEEHRKAEMARARRDQAVLGHKERKEEREQQRNRQKLEEMHKQELERKKGIDQAQKDIDEGKTIADDPRFHGQVQCQACGLHGHTAGNKICILYHGTQREKERQRAAEETSGSLGLVQQTTGTRMRFDTARLAQVAPEPRLRIDLKKTSEYLRKKEQADHEEHVRKGKAGSLPTESRSRRRAGAADVKLNQELEAIVKELQASVRFGTFNYDVSKVPGYTQVITDPVDLLLMRKKCQKVAYKRLQDFRNDLDLIVSNCNAFNTKYGRNLDFEPLAEELREAGNAAMRERDDDLVALECDQMAAEDHVLRSPGVRPKRARPAGADQRPLKRPSQRATGRRKGKKPKEPSPPAAAAAAAPPIRLTIGGGARDASADSMRSCGSAASSAFSDGGETSDSGDGASEWETDAEQMETDTEAGTSTYGGGDSASEFGEASEADYFGARGGARADEDRHMDTMANDDDDDDDMEEQIARRMMQGGA